MSLIDHARESIEATEIPLSAIVAGVGAMDAYTDEAGCVSREDLEEAFREGLRAALQSLVS